MINAGLLFEHPTAILGLANPFQNADQGIATWFHARLTPAFAGVLHALTEFGSGESIGIAVFLLVAFFVWKRWWPSLMTLLLAVPCGMLLNEWLKIAVHRQRPFVAGAFVDWSGYSFASGHTMGATLFYGQLLLFALPFIKGRQLRLICIFSAASLVLLVGFTRIALGAHFLTDVLAAIFFGIIWLMLCTFLGKSLGRRSVPLAIPASRGVELEH